jgi:hypothetical protein
MEFVALKRLALYGSRSATLRPNKINAAIVSGIFVGGPIIAFLSRAK